MDPQPHRTIDYQDHFEDEDVLHSVGGEMCVLLSCSHSELKCDNITYTIVNITMTVTQ